MNSTSKGVSPTDKQFLQELGYMTVAFSSLDHNMNAVIWSLLETSIEGGAALTNEIFSVPAKLRVIEKLSTELLSSQAHDEVVKLTREIEKINSDRNNYIHSLWAKSGEPPDLYLVLLNFKKKKDPYKEMQIPTMPELLNLIERIHKSNMALVKLITDKIQPAHALRAQHMGRHT